MRLQRGNGIEGVPANAANENFILHAFPNCACNSACRNYGGECAGNREPTGCRSGRSRGVAQRLRCSA